MIHTVTLPIDDVVRLLTLAALTTDRSPAERAAVKRTLDALRNLPRRD